jgi:hypothetical protein
MDGEGLTTDQLKSLEEYLPTQEEEGQVIANSAVQPACYLLCVPCGANFSVIRRVCVESTLTRHPRPSRHRADCLSLHSDERES